MFISHNSAQLYTVEFGNGPRTILAHGGWTGSWELWTGPFQSLSKTWRAIAYDHRGTGATVAPVESISIENMVGDLFAVMDGMNIERCVLAAESAGGIVAVTAALQQPERFEGLVLVDALLHKESDESDVAFIHGLKTHFQETITAFANACVPTAEIQIPTLLLHGDQDVIVPVSDSNYAAAQIPNNHLHIFEKAGHVPTMTRPDEVAKQINQFFLNR